MKAAFAFALSILLTSNALAFEAPRFGDLQQNQFTPVKVEKGPRISHPSPSGENTPQKTEKKQKLLNMWDLMNLTRTV